MMEEPTVDESEIDMYELLGVAPPTHAVNQSIDHDNILAAFMDDDDDEEPDEIQSGVDTEQLLTTLARELFEEEKIGVDNAHLHMESLKVHKDNDAYHLSLIMEMGGTQIRPFATVLSTSNGPVPLQAPKGLHQKWKPVYNALQRALTEAMGQIQRSTFA